MEFNINNPLAKGGPDAPSIPQYFFVYAINVRSRCSGVFLVLSCPTPDRLIFTPYQTWPIAIIIVPGDFAIRRALTQTHVHVTLGIWTCPTVSSVRVWHDNVIVDGPRSAIITGNINDYYCPSPLPSPDKPCTSSRNNIYSGRVEAHHHNGWNDDDW